MTMAPTLERYLTDQGTTYQLLSHSLTQTAAETAHASHVSGNCLAKGVLLADGDGYLLAVLPASHQLDLDRLGAWLGRPVSLASEQEVGRLFPDCELGAIPAIGWASTGALVTTSAAKAWAMKWHGIAQQPPRSLTVSSTATDFAPWLIQTEMRCSQILKERQHW